MKKYLEKKKQNAERCNTLQTLAICSSLEAIEHIGVGCFYELDHSKLPPNAPELLKSIRIVMVSKKAMLKVSVSFPSIDSLQAFLSENGGSVKNQLPALDEKYFLEPEAASEVLYRRVPPEEISERRKVWSFWAVVTRRRFESIVRNPVKKETRPPEISLNGLVQWGTRKRVRFLSPTRSPSPVPVSDEETEVEEGGGLDEETSEEEEKEAEAEVVVVKNRRSERRKQPIKSQKKPKREEQSKQTVVHSKSERRMVRASVARWSTGRYKMAEENMLKVLKARGATAGKPIKRAALRNEARKLIGDTGLLDHLLKHMAGKVAPGGAERFRRRHNADGAMEYWLESADLVEIRKEAGVQDPYWTPPQGWKPGDDPSQDPVCATMFKELWDEIAKMKKREKESKQPEQGLAMVPITSNSLVTSMDWDQAYSSVMQLKDKYTQLAVRKSKCEEQMQQASQTLSRMEEEIMALKSTMQAPAAALMYYSEAADVPQLTDDERRANEDKATKLERLRSGFRICRPQGTFLWPNMNMSVSQHQIDPSAVPTTPSVTFSTKPANQLDLVLTQSPHAPSPGSSSGSLVKPFPERRAVNTSTLLCSVINPPSLSPAFTRVSSEIEKTTSLSQSSKTLQINLNEIPGDAQHNESTAISRTLTYQRRRQLMKARKEKNADARKDSMSLRGNSKSDHQKRW
uniref:protein DYAD-like n=1 Tax=Fragaria vesca subsp. vesca TaxID=101020 RepID=UPI0005C8AADA|nr:PREDICTED: protein DYAD-like [Fragaria vesca subsp. vesca]